MSNSPWTKTSIPGVYRRGSVYVVKQRDQTGKMHSRSAATLAEAREIQASLRADSARGDQLTVTKQRFDAYARDWIETYTGRTSRGFKESTRDGYRSALECHAIPFFGRTPLAEVKPRDIKRFAAHATDKGLSRDGVRNVLAPVKAMLATAFEDGDIRVNPAANVRIATKGIAKPTEKRARALSQNQLDVLLANAPGDGRLLLLLLARTGLRIGEALALRWQDVDLDASNLSVERTVFRGEFGTPKSKYGIRTVTISSELRTALRKHRVASPYSSDASTVFTAAGGTMLDPNNVLKRIMRPAAIAADVPWATLHTLRHTFASICFRNGCNAKQVQMMLGHHSAAFTIETYIHLMPEDMPSLDFLDSSPERGGTRPAI